MGVRGPHRRKRTPTHTNTPTHMHTQGSFCLRQPHFIHDAAYDPELPNVRRCVCVFLLVCVWVCVCFGRCDSVTFRWAQPGVKRHSVRPPCYWVHLSSVCVCVCVCVFVCVCVRERERACVCVCVSVWSPFIFRECMCCLPAPGPRLTNSSKPHSIDHKALGYLLWK